MGRRSNPLSTRVGRLISWPSSVSHPFLTSYISHIFQECIVARPGIRSSTTGLWNNLTLFPSSKAKEKMDYSHPKIKNPVLDFKGVGLENVLGRFEERTRMLGQSHKFFQKQFKNGSWNGGEGGKTFLEAVHGENKKTFHALHIYRYFLFFFHRVSGIFILLILYDLHLKLIFLFYFRDTPIHLKVNIITNPLLNAEVMAQQIAHAAARNVSISRIFKEYLKSMK